VQVDHPAAESLMVLPAANLMVLIERRRLAEDQ
jgi:hypothetical protein